MKKSSIICLTSGFILVAIGMSFLLALPMILLKIIDSKIVLNVNNPSFELWKDLPIPIVMRFYIFNVTNSEQIQSSGAVPNFQQIGPFAFRLDVKKSDINFTDSDQKVSFRENIVYYFDRQLSSDDLSLKVTTINTPLAIALDLSNDLNPMMKILSTILINYLNKDFFIERTVGELLFDGYPDILIELAPLLNPKIPLQSAFGWMYNRNDTNDGLFIVNTGKTDVQKLNAIESLNGSPDLSYWSAPSCNSLKGAKNGELYNPITNTEQTLEFFRTDLCRVWTLVWESSLKSMGDLHVYRYFPADNTYANSTDYPPNSCYKPLISDKSDKNDFNITAFIKTLKTLVQNDSELFDTLEEAIGGDFSKFYWKGFGDFYSNETNNFKPIESKFREYPSGVFDMAPCHFGAPIFISNPHFLKADPYYLSKVSGLSPNASLHQTYLDIEPITGTPVELQLRIQINVRIDSFANNFKQYKKIPKIHMPVLWQEFSINLTDKIVNDLHWTLTWPSIIATIVSSLFVAIGALTLLFVASKPVLKRCAHCWTKSDTTADNCDTRALIDDNIESDDSQPVMG